MRFIRGKGYDFLCEFLFILKTRVNMLFCYSAYRGETQRTIEEEMRVKIILPFSRDEDCLSGLLLYLWLILIDSAFVLIRLLFNHSDIISLICF